MEKERNLVQDDEVISSQEETVTVKSNKWDRKIPHEIKQLDPKWEISHQGKSLLVGNMEITPC